jgi:acetyl-CoA carboxylase biotin carboxyl carrier protein
MTSKKILATKNGLRAPARVKPSSKIIPKAGSSSIAQTEPNVQVGTISMQQVKEVIGLIKDAVHFNTFSYKTPEFEIEIEVGNRRSPEVSSSANLGGATQTTAPKALEAIKPRSQAGLFEVLSPMVGTFYRRPNPTSPPFVEIGSKVSPDTPVCLVEVMKLLNTILAEHAGKIIDIFVADGETIEAGQVLMVIEL